MSSELEHDSAVAYLVIHRADDATANVNLPIDANVEFDLGRQDVNNIIGVNDGTISKHHLRFHCVTYGENSVATIEPLVYVRSLSRHGVRILQASPDGSNSTCFLQSGQPSVLLNHGDTLQLSSKISIRYDAVFEDVNERRHLGSVAETEARSFEKQYSIMPRGIGAGGFANVFLAVNMKSRRQVACKVVPLPKKPPVPDLSDWSSQKVRKAPAHHAVAHLAARHRKKCQDLRREFEILKGIDHPNIIRLEKAIYATEHVYIFQELVSGGDLLSYLERKGGLDEPEAAVMIFQLLKALEYLHGRGIVHRDIKPENILLTSWRKGSRIVLSDFGHSRKLIEEGNAAKNAQAASRMRSLVGTHGYAAPEVYMRPDDDHESHQSGYNEAVDVWSVGCLAGTLLTNTFLFPREDSRNSQAAADDDPNNLQVAFSLQFLDTSKDWQRASRTCKSFIRGCAMVDDSQRLTVAQALQHPWVAHPSFAAAMRAEYERAIADWTPRTNTNDLIEYVKAPAARAKTAEPGFEARLHQEVRSHHFTSEPTPIGQFRAFGTSYHTATLHETALSPIDNSLRASSKKPAARTIPATSGDDVDAANSIQSKKRQAEDNMSYLSIYDYVPPVSYPPSQPCTQSLPQPNSWDTRLAESMDLDVPPASIDTTALPKKMRI